MDARLREEIVDHLVAAIDRAPLVRKPFDHIRFSSAFPDRVYSAMLGSLPPRELWESVHAALTSEELRHVTCARLRIPERGFPLPRLVHNLPGYWIEPHPDSRAKHATMQFYLAPDASHEELGTTLYRLKPFRPAVWLRREHVMEKAGQFPFLPDSGYAFGVRWNSFHGVERIAESSGERHTLMNIYYRREQRPQ